MFQPIVQGLVGWCAEWHDTLLVAFAGHFHRAVAECHVGHVESDQFRHTHAGGIEQFQHGRVTQRDRLFFHIRFLRSRLHAVLINAVHQLLRLRFVQYRRQRIGDFRRLQRSRRVGGRHVMVVRPCEESTHGDGFARHAAACVIFGRFGHPQAQILDGHLIQIYATLFPQRHQAFLDIAAVRPAGVCAQPSVGFQIGVESVQRIIETHANHLPLRLK